MPVGPTTIVKEKTNPLTDKAPLTLAALISAILMTVGLTFGEKLLDTYPAITEWTGIDAHLIKLGVEILVPFLVALIFGAKVWGHNNVVLKSLK